MPAGLTGQAKPKNDAYTVLLTISLVAMIGACLLLFYDVKRYPSLTPKDSDIRVTLPVQTGAPTEPAGGTEPQPDPSAAQPPPAPAPMP
jgi:hypothetical protein